MIEFFCPGIARPKGSKRMVRTTGGRTRLLEESRREKPWSERVSFAAVCAMQGSSRFADEALSLGLVFGFPRPKSHYTTKGLRPGAPTWHTGKPDSSKLARSVEDALNGIVWDDDSRIAQLYVLKLYVDRDLPPGVALSVGSVPDGDTAIYVAMYGGPFYRRVAAIGIELEVRG